MTISPGLHALDKIHLEEIMQHSRMSMDSTRTMSTVGEVFLGDGLQDECHVQLLMAGGSNVNRQIRSTPLSRPCEDCERKTTHLRKQDRKPCPTLLLHVPAAANNCSRINANEVDCILTTSSLLYNTGKAISLRTRLNPSHFTGDKNYLRQTRHRRWHIS